MVYRSFDDEMKARFGGKVYRISLSSGCGCPNRDGTCGTGGCIFCSEGGSGEFSEQAAGMVPAACMIPAAEPTDEASAGTATEPAEEAAFGPAAEFADETASGQAIERAKARIAAKAGRSPAGYIAYFQAFTNTYGDADELERLYTEVIKRDDILALSIATRPDCLPEDIMAMLGRLRSVKPVWVELGLQTIRDDTAEYIGRGYRTAVYDEAVRKLHEADIEVITHMIVGLPGEDEEDALRTAEHIARQGSEGIKISLLYILQGTELGRRYLEDKSIVREYTLEEYTELIGSIMKKLPDSMVYHRITGDPPRRLLIGPQWTTDKKRVLNYMSRYLRGITQ